MVTKIGSGGRNIALFLLRFVLFTSWIIPASVHAHEMGWSYAFIDVEDDGIRGRLELPLEKLQGVIDLDSDGNGQIDEAEIQNSWQEIEAQINSMIAFGSTEGDYKVQMIGHHRLPIEVADFVVVDFVLETPSPLPSMLSVNFRPFFNIDPDHRGGLIIENNVFTGVEGNHGVLAAIFAPNRYEESIDLRGEPLWTQLWRFVIEGVWHIWIGIDHVLFLITLLLAAVMTRKKSRWEPVANFRHAFLNLFKIVTLFTIAHTITLALALKGWVSLSPRFVESVIALSVVAVAVNNLKPVFSERIWVLVFVFGLFHGLGFASVLLDLLVTRQSKIASLIGFNIGVELGQLAIVSVVFPALYFSRNRLWYARYFLPIVSSVIGLIGFWWLVTRALNISSPFGSF